MKSSCMILQSNHYFCQSLAQKFFNARIAVNFQIITSTLIQLERRFSEYCSQIIFHDIGKNKSSRSTYKLDY